MSIYFTKDDKYFVGLYKVNNFKIYKYSFI